MPTSATFTRKVICINENSNDPSVVNVVPNKLRKTDLNFAVLRGGISAYVASFITGASITPIVGIPNYFKSIRRLSVQRAPEGVDSVRVFTKGTRNPAQFKAELSVEVTRFLNAEVISQAADKVLEVQDGFRCHSNAANTDIKLTLPAFPLSAPNAIKEAAGLTYYFFVRAGAAGAGTALVIEAAGINRLIDQSGSKHESVASNTAGATIAVRLSGEVAKNNKVLWAVENASNPGGPDWSFA